MKKNKFVLFGIAAIILALSFSLGHNAINAVEEDTTDHDTIDLYSTKIEETSKRLFKTETSATYRTQYIADKIINEAEHTSASLLWAGYAVKNIRKNGIYTNDHLVVSSDDLLPESTVTFQINKTFPTVIDGVRSIKAAEFNAKVGLNSSASVSAAKAFTYSCPKKKGNKTVTSCTIAYYPIYQSYEFDESFLGLPSGTGNAKVLIGFAQDETINFQK